MASGTPTLARNEHEAIRFDNLWEEAYTKLQNEEPKLMKAYQQTILEAARSKCKDSRNVQLQNVASSIKEFQKQLIFVIEVQLEYIDERRWVLKFGQKKVAIHDAVCKIVNGVTAAKDFITQAVSCEPHAALAWAGISCLLPFVLDALKQDDDAIEGLDYVQNLLARYQVVQQVLMENRRIELAGFDDVELRKRMRSGVLSLYLLTLKYQFLMAKHFCRSLGRRVWDNIKDPIIHDDWKTRLTGVKEAEKTTEQHRKVLETELHALTSDAIHDQIPKLDKLLAYNAEQEAERQQEKLRDWLKSLFPTNMDALHNLLRDQIRESDSGQWFVQEVRSFLEDEHDATLWGYGIPGAGKSIVMSTAIQNATSYIAEHSIDAVSWIYCQWAIKLQQTPVAVLASILVKLFSHSATLSAALQALYDSREASSTPPDARDLSELLINHGQLSATDGQLENIGPKTHARFLIFLDGLDEAQDSTRSTLISCINDLDRRYFKVVITCREDLPIQTNSDVTRQSRITADSKDLALYIKAQLEERKRALGSQILESNPKLLTELVKNIRDQARGMFLHAKYHTLYVGNLLTAPEMLQAAQKPFTNLEAIYSDILKHLSLDSQVSEQHAVKALAWLTYAKRGMDRSTLMEALAISPGDSNLDPDAVPDIEPIVRQCRGLVIFDKSSSIVRLAHETVQGYLSSNPLISMHMETIAAVCFTRLAMSSEIKNKTIFSSAEPIGHLEVEPRKPTRQSTTDWLEDLEKSDSDDEEDDDDAAIFSPSVLEETTHAGDDDPESLSDRSDIEMFVKITGYYGESVDPSTLDVWSRQMTDFSRYAGTFAISHLLDLADCPKVVTDSLWDMLMKRPRPELLSGLIGGNNHYPFGQTPMHVACFLRHIPTVSRLRETGIDIDVRDEKGRTPLISAARHGAPEMIRGLLATGADPAALDLRGTTAIENLAFDVDEALARDMIPKTRNLPYDVMNDAAERGLANVIKVYLDQEIGNPKYGHALASACGGGHLDIAEMLYSRGGADVNADTWGISNPLHFAIAGGNPNLVAFVLEKGAHPDSTDERNRPALVHLACGGDVKKPLPESTVLDMLKVLLRYKPELDLQSGEVRDPLWYRKVSDSGSALWEAASRRKYPKLVKALLKAGCDLHKEYCDLTAFQSVALRAPGSKVYDILHDAEQKWVEKQGQPFSAVLSNSKGDTILHIAATESAADLVDSVLNIPGTDVDARDRNGKTPLFWAMHPTGTTIVQKLLKAGAKTTTIDYTGNSILDAAIVAAPREVIATILQGSCSTEAPWSIDQPEIQQFVDAPWFERLRTMIAQRAARVASKFRTHVRATLDQPKIVQADQPDYQEGYEQYEQSANYQSSDKRILAVEIPETEGGKAVKVEKVTFTFRSCDKGFSWSNYGGSTWQGCSSWFEAGIQRDDEFLLQNTRRIQANLRDSPTYRWYCVSWEADSPGAEIRRWMESLRPGDRIVVLAQGDGDDYEWENKVADLSIDVYCN